jgi:hypothetical protein
MEYFVGYIAHKFVNSGLKYWGLVCTSKICAAVNNRTVGWLQQYLDPYRYKVFYCEPLYSKLTTTWSVQVSGGLLSADGCTISWLTLMKLTDSMARSGELDKYQSTRSTPDTVTFNLLLKTFKWKRQWHKLFVILLHLFHRVTFSWCLQNCQRNFYWTI